MDGQYPGISVSLILIVLTAILVIAGAFLFRRGRLKGRGPLFAWVIVSAIPLLAAFYWPVSQPEQHEIKTGPTVGSDVQR